MATFAVVHTNSDTGFTEVKISQSLLAAEDWVVEQIRAAVEEGGERFAVDHEGDDYGVSFYRLESGHTNYGWYGYDEYVIVECSHIW